MMAELKKQGLLNSTLIIITAKHGQSPININNLVRIPADNSSCLPATFSAEWWHSSPKTTCH